MKSKLESFHHFAVAVILIAKRFCKNPAPPQHYRLDDIADGYSDIGVFYFHQNFQKTSYRFRYFDTYFRKSRTFPDFLCLLSGRKNLFTLHYFSGRSWLFEGNFCAPQGRKKALR